MTPPIKAKGGLLNRDDTREAYRNSDGMRSELGDDGTHTLASDVTTGHDRNSKLTRRNKRETPGQSQVLSETQKPVICWQPVSRCSPF